MPPSQPPDDPYARLSVIADFITAGATVVAVILAAIAGYVAYRLYNVESRRDAKADHLRGESARELRRQQAAAVSVVPLESDRISREVKVELGNHSPLPIYDAYLCVSIRSAIFTASGDRDGKDFEGYLNVRKGELKLLAPGASYTFSFSLADVIPDHGEWLEAEIAPRLTFRDNAGLAWSRDGGSGNLHEISMFVDDLPGLIAFRYPYGMDDRSFPKQAL